MCNVDEASVKTGNAYVDKVKAMAAEEGAEVLMLGAKIESEAMFAVAAGIGGAIDKPIPKRLVFDRPFWVFFKRWTTMYPYAAAWIADTELLVKRQTT